MTAPVVEPRRARVGSFEVDLRAGELHPRDPAAPGRPVLLREQPFQILRMLIERAGKIVTRPEIQKTLWPNDTIVDFNRSISEAILQLRRALGDSAANPRYIETLGRRGYRLIPPVEWLQTGPVGPGTSRPPAPVVAPAERPAPLGELVGKRLGHYRVLEVLGGGGMGLVYKADDLKLGRQVALKFLPEELAGDPIALLRLEREARTLSALNHPNICTLFDIQNESGHPFIVMELLEGQTLSQRIAASAPNAIPTPELVDVAIQVCTGLEAAHRKDIVHRDIKPANIFLTIDGPVKVLDFGVAKLITTGSASEENEGPQKTTGPSPATDPTLTRTGAAVGTTRYMSPEQERKEPLDARSDLYSLGLVLHEMATGRRASGEESSSTDPRALAPTPRAEESRSGRSLDAIIRRATQKDRERRFQAASEMRRELEQVRERMRRSPKGYPRFPLAGLLFLALAVSGTWLSLRRGRATVSLAPDDTILVAHLTNKTSDRVFDDAIFTALRVALEQTPYLNVMQEPKLRSALAPLKLGESAPITPEIALDVCRRTDSKLVVAPMISDAGNRLRVALTATDCRSGKNIAQVSPPAVGRDAVVHTVGVAATQLRALLGEPSDSIARFNAPAEQATTASPEALELLTIGYRRHLLGKPAEALSYYQRATQTDPNFALAHVAVSAAYESEKQPALAAAASRRAFELRDRLTVPGRFHVDSVYYTFVTGEEEKACATLAEWVKIFPYDLIARNNFSSCLSNLGELDRALGQTREAARLLPTPWEYRLWMNRSLYVDRLEEARGVYDEALRLGFDSPDLRQSRLALALLEHDDATLQSELSRTEGNPALRRGSLAIRSAVEQHHGRFRASLRLAKLSEASKGMDDSEDDLVEHRSMLMAVEAGVRVRLHASKKLPPTDLATRILEALILARVGQATEARDAAEALRREFPSHTLIQNYILPILDAAMKLQSNDAAGALEALRPAARYELTTWGPFPELYSAYLGGLARLRTGDGRAAATEFQKIFNHPGLVGVSAFDSMARLQLARAQALTGDVVAARSSYEEFLALWKDADDDLPLHREASEEYRKLRGR